MDLKRLEYFITIVDVGNISAAAKILHMSQPPLSTHMKLLENELGCVLFERGARQIKLTEAGQILYNKAIALLDLSNSTLEELETYKKGISGTLRLGIVSSVGSIFLSDWLLPFHKAHPDLHYEIFEANTYALLEQLKSNSLDFVVVRTPFAASSFKSIPLSQESMVAIGSEHFFSGTKKEESIALKDLCHKPILLYRRWESILTNLLREKNLEWDFFCKNDDARTTLLWANEGLGIGIVPESAKGFADPSRTVVKKIVDCSICSTISVAYHPNDTHSLTANKFLAYIKSSKSSSL